MAKHVAKAAIELVVTADAPLSFVSVVTVAAVAVTVKPSGGVPPALVNSVVNAATNALGSFTTV